MVDLAIRNDEQSGVPAVVQGVYVELRDLRYFETLASELNFGRAANVLHLTQPALSLAVAPLERGSPRLSGLRLFLNFCGVSVQSGQSALR